MADTFYNFGGDAFNNDAFIGYHNIKSAYYSGAFTNITAPATQNYPPSGTATRYAIYLPIIPYIGDFVTYPMNLRDVTTSTTLSRVTGTPAANQYRVAPATSKTPQVIELHSGQAGHAIGFEYYGMGSILSTGLSNILELKGTAQINNILADTMLLDDIASPAVGNVVNLNYINTNIIKRYKVTQTDATATSLSLSGFTLTTAQKAVIKIRFNTTGASNFCRVRLNNDTTDAHYITNQQMRIHGAVETFADEAAKPVTSGSTTNGCSIDVDLNYVSALYWAMKLNSILYGSSADPSIFLCYGGFNQNVSITSIDVYSNNASGMLVGSEIELIIYP